MAIDELTYPEPRIRTGSVPTSPAPPLKPVGVGGVRARNWFVHLREANGFGLVGSPLFKGPALVHQISFASAGTTFTNPIPDLALHYDGTPYANLTNGALTTLVKGTALFEGTVLNDAPFTIVRGNAIPVPSVANPHPAWTPNYWIPSADFYLAWSIRNQQAAGAEMWVWVVVYEGVPEDEIRDFL